MVTDPSQKKSEDDAAGQYHFVSYSRRDSAFMKRLKDELENGEPPFRVWVDQSEMKPGPWPRQLEDAIDSCCSCLLIVSEESNKSPDVARELHRACEGDKPIIPLILDSKVKAPFQAGGYQSVYFLRGGDFGKGLAQLLKLLGDLELRKSFKKQEPVHQTPLTTPITINDPPLVAPTYFQGRTDQQQRIEEFLSDNTRTLLWISGRAGSGKTALACCVLERVQREVWADSGKKNDIDAIAYVDHEQHARSDWLTLFNKARRLVTPRGVTDPQKPAQGHSRTFDIPNLLADLAGRRVVFLIDHIDDLIDLQTHNIRGQYIRDALQAVLTATTCRLKVIVTSQILPRDLQTAQQARWFTLDLAGGLPEHDAMQLFKVLDGDGTLGLQRGDEALLTELCRRTQCNPGAIERLHTMVVTNRSTTPKAILQDEKRFLPEGVVVALIGKRYICLDEVSKTMMQILSVCKKPLAAHAVVSVFHLYYPVGDHPAIDPHEILKRLVNMQLVQQREQGYFLLAADQWYVVSQLSADASSTVGGSQDVHLDRNTLYKRHADYIAQMVSTNDPTVGSGLDTLQLEQLHYYRFNGKDYAAAFDVLERLESQLLAEGRSVELIGHCEQLIGKLEDPTRSRQLFDMLARTYHRRGDLDRAAACYEGGLKCVRDTGDLNRQCLYLGNLAICKQESGDLVRTTLYCMAALELAGQIGNRVWEAHIWNIIGEVLASLGQISAAMRASKRALKLARDNRQLEVEVMGIFEVVALANLGQHHEAQGNIDQADGECSRAYEFAEHLEFQLGKATAKRNLGILDLNQGKYKQAARHLTEAMQLVKNAQNVQLQQTILIELAAAQLMDSKLGDAELTVNTAVAIDTPFFTPEAYSLRGIILQRKGKLQEAAESFHHALKQAEVVLKRTPRYYRGLDVMGLSYVGLTLSEETDEYIDKAIGAYEAARFIIDEPGIVRRRLLLFSALAKDEPEKRVVLVRNAITLTP
jgi:tetratricopeptide (TPR) repeat protein